MGNPVAQAAALAVLDVIEDEGLVARSVAIGETMRSRMESWQQRWPAVGDVRGLGAMLAIELVSGDKVPATDLASRVVDEALSGASCAEAGVAATASGCWIRSSSPTPSSTKRSTSEEALRSGRRRCLAAAPRTSLCQVGTSGVAV